MRMLALRNGLSGWNHLQREMDDLLHDVWGENRVARRSRSGLGQGATPLRVWEDADSYHLEAELPGLKLDDIELLVHRNEVTLSGERKIDLGDDAKATRRERVAGKFQRKLKLPAELNADKAEASLVNGVLTLTLPKAETAKPRKIEVSAG